MKQFDFNALADAVKAGNGNPLAGLFNREQAIKEAEAMADKDREAFGSTTRAWFERWLYDHAIFPETCKKIMDYVIEKVDAEMDAEAKKHDENAVGYRVTWNRPASEYPDAFYATLIMTHVKRHVFAWANENMPEAFWKPAFDPNFKFPATDSEK